MAPCWKTLAEPEMSRTQLRKFFRHQARMRSQIAQDVRLKQVKSLELIPIRSMADNDMPIDVDSGSRHGNESQVSELLPATPAVRGHEYEPGGDNQDDIKPKPKRRLVWQPVRHQSRETQTDMMGWGMFPAQQVRQHLDCRGHGNL